VDAPAPLQYAAAHRNSPGKYLIELPLYLFPWTFLTIAALRRAWRHRRSNFDNRAVRFGLAASLPPLLVLSLAATARNIYFAPALPGIALLLAWWAWEILPGPDRWDVRALRATAALLLAAAAVFCAALTVLAVADRGTLVGPAATVLISTAGVAAAVLLAVRAWGAAPTHALRAQYSLLLAYCALLVGPASQVYRQVDRWQDLAGIGSRIAADAAGKPLILLAPDETTRAFIDMYVRTSVLDIPGPLALETAELQKQAAAAPESRFLVQWRGADRGLRQWLERGAQPDRDELPAEWQPWMRAAQLEPVGIYSVPHGRRYVLLRTHP
jgi:4-amino-4-deoxy-L-arabinose transferase-like glycosyltransferase